MAQAEQASVAVAPALDIAPAEPKAEIALTAPGRLEAMTGDELAFDITIDSDDALPARSVIAIRAMPEGATFSQGRPYGATEWNLRPDEIGDLTSGCRNRPAAAPTSRRADGGRRHDPCRRHHQARHRGRPASGADPEGRGERPRRRISSRMARR